MDPPKKWDCSMEIYTAYIHIYNYNYKNNNNNNNNNSNNDNNTNNNNIYIPQLYVYNMNIYMYIIWIYIYICICIYYIIYTYVYMGKSWTLLPHSWTMKWESKLGTCPVAAQKEQRHCAPSCSAPPLRSLHSSQHPSHRTLLANG